MLTKQQLLQSIQKISVPKGRPVTVHCSLKAIGELDGRDLLDALITHFTKDGGLLCIPTHTWNRDFLNLNSSDCCIGVLPCLAAADPRGIRSLHPSHSMAVFGDRAKEFTESEQYTDTPTSPEGCYGNLYKMGGYVLLIGVGQDKNTYIHCVEEMLGVRGRLTQNKVEKYIIHKDGSKQARPLYWFDEREIPDVSVNFVKFEKAFRHFGAIEDYSIGNATVQLCNAVRIKDVLEKIYSKSEGKELLADDAPLDPALYK